MSLKCYISTCKDVDFHCLSRKWLCTASLTSCCCCLLLLPSAAAGRVYPRYGIHEISEMDDREPYKV